MWKWLWVAPCLVHIGVWFSNGIGRSCSCIILIVWSFSSKTATVACGGNWIFFATVSESWSIIEIFLFNCIGKRGLFRLGRGALKDVNWETWSSPSSVPPNEKICGSRLLSGDMLWKRLRRGTSFSLVGSLKGGGFFPNSPIVL